MKKLTPLMNKSIMSLYKNGNSEELNKSTLKALNQRKITNSNGQLTEFGERYAISRLPLAKQCEAINLELETVELQYVGRPEPAALAHFKSLGYEGVSCEGIGFLTVLKALMLNKLAEYNPFNERNDACTRYLEAQFTILKDNINDVISEINNVTKEQYITNFEEIISQPFISLEYPELNIEFATAVYDAVDKELFYKVANKIAEDPYLYRNGWPDLTIVKNGNIEFIEVKTTDKLHESQLITIPVMRKILPFNFYAIRLIN